MTGIIEIDRLHRVTLVVEDLEAATRRYAEVFGVDAWEVRDFTAERLAHTESYGRRTEPEFRTAIGHTVPRNGGSTPWTNAGVEFELVEPMKGESPFMEFSAVRHEGICGMRLSVADHAELDVIRSGLAERGIGLAAAMTIDGIERRYFFDTRKALGGFLVEVAVPLMDGEIPVTERWDHSGTYTRPDGMEPFDVQGVSHFGVVVDDVMATLKEYNEIFGLEKWTINNWRAREGSLDAPYYRGESVNHEYFTGIVQVGDTGFEIIQPTFGPSAYNRDFRDLWGPGVHHMLLHVTSDAADWARTGEWLDSIGLPLLMGSDLRHGVAHFCYFDTHADLGGFTIEAVFRNTAVAPPAPSPTTYTVDFGAKAESVGVLQ